MPLRDQLARAGFERVQAVAEQLTRRLDPALIGIAFHVERLADHESDRRARLRNLGAVPAVQRPVPIGLEMKRQHWIARRLRQPHRARLRHARRSARPVDRESGRLAGRHVARQLQQRLPRASRRRSPCRAVSEPLDDAGDPLAVEVLARDDDDAAAAEKVGGRKNTSVPERHDRLVTGVTNRVEMMQTLGAPLQRRAQDRNGRITDGGDRSRLKAF
jgi:hypothetical protein